MSKLENGRAYEKYIRDIIKNKYKECWLWEDIPINILDNRFYKNDIICDDIGCDIIGINNDNTIDYIQCKNYSTTGEDNTINISDLSGFYNFIAENSITNAIVYYSGKLSQQIICRMNKIKYINVPLILNKDILKITPRDYQIEAYNKLKSAHRSILSMPCGTGKTLVSYMLSMDYKNIIILSPLISTTEQLLIHFKNYYNDDTINYILVNCKAKRKVDLTNGKNIIASTYDSINIINNSIYENCLIIIDEFHNLSSEMINGNNNMNKLLISNYNILFMSATPIKNNNDNIFGKTIYELSWDDAIKNKYICDYNFYYPNNTKLIKQINNLKINSSLVSKNIYINKAYFLLESIKLTNVKKCIVYLKSIKESEEFNKILKVINIYFDLPLKIYEINYNTNNTNRKKYMNKFTKDNSNINIICNVHILDEGIDIPECDSIYLTHPNNNIINIIQRISRANRLDSNNMDKIAKVFIWSKNDSKLEQINFNISKIIKIKYGIEKSDYVNNLLNIQNDTINDNYQQNKTSQILNDYYEKVNTYIVDDEIKEIMINNVICDNNNIIWFQAKKITLALGYKDTKDALRRHILKNDKKFISEINHSFNIKIQPKTLYITNYGLYKLIYCSKLPKAKLLLEFIKYI